MQFLDQLRHLLPDKPAEDDLGKIPPKCERCHVDKPRIRVHYKDYDYQGFQMKEYICYDCKNRDSYLGPLPVRKKTQIKAQNKPAVTKPTVTKRRYRKADFVSI